MAAAQKSDVTLVTVSGGVSCNEELRRQLYEACGRNAFAFKNAEPWLCTDNAAMIGFAALSVHNHGSAFLNANPLRPHASYNCLRSSSLQLTPPLTVTRSTWYFCAAAIVFVTSTSIIACWNDAQRSANTRSSNL